MDLDIVLIDMLRPDGGLTTYRVLPTTGSRGLTMDRLRGIHPERFGDADLDIGGTRIYNASRCSIDKITSRLGAFELEADGILSALSSRTWAYHSDLLERRTAGRTAWFFRRAGDSGTCFFPTPTIANTNVSRKKQFRPRVRLALVPPAAAFDTK